VICNASFPDSEVMTENTFPVDNGRLITNVDRLNDVSINEYSEEPDFLEKKFRETARLGEKQRNYIMDAIVVVITISKLVLTYLTNHLCVFTEAQLNLLMTNQDTTVTVDKPRSIREWSSSMATSETQNCSCVLFYIFILLEINCLIQLSLLVWIEVLTHTLVHCFTGNESEGPFSDTELDDSRKPDNPLVINYGLLVLID
jgi:hypothetical protein